MRRYLGHIIKRARLEKGLSQKRLIEEIGEENVSLRTLRRIEMGYQRASTQFENILLDYFGIKLLLLRDAYEEKIMRRYLFEGCEDLNISDCLDAIIRQVMEYRTVCSSKSSHRITNILEFVIYYPLLDTGRLIDVIQRIGGDTHDRLDYIISQFDYLYTCIPDSQLKTIADKLAMGIWDSDKRPSAEEYELYRELVDHLTQQVPNM